MITKQQVLDMATNVRDCAWPPDVKEYMVLIEPMLRGYAALLDDPSPINGKYGAVLAPFVRMMDKELHDNAGKGDRLGWLSMDRKTAVLEIFHHVAKLQKAALNDDLAGVREYSADVANMSMMLADICGLLAEHDSKER